MGKLDSNKKQKRESLLNTAFQLFITNGIQKTTISDIVKDAGVAKGTFYLYFKDKYDIRNKLVAHKASQLFTAALQECTKQETDNFEDKIIFVIDYIVDILNQDKSLLKFLSKNLGWGVFKNALTSPASEEDVNVYESYLQIIRQSGCEIVDPELMLFLIVELVDAAIYSSILYEEPVPIQKLKPELYDTIRYIIRSHDKARSEGKE